MKMIRRKFHNNKTIPYANSLSRCNPFVINPEKATSKYTRRKYGEAWLSVRGIILSERADLTFTTLLKMTDGIPGRTIEGCVSDIALSRGVGNPYDEKILGAIRKDIDQLLSAEIKININQPSKEKRFRAKFTLLEGYVNSDDTFSLTVSSHLKEIKELVGFFYLNTEMFLHLQSPIVRQLYKFFVSQKFIKNEGAKYNIVLQKLCYFIGWEVEDKSWFAVRQIMKRSLDSLKRKNIIKKYKLDNETHKQEGGMVVVYGKKNIKETSDPLPVNQSSQLSKSKTKENNLYDREIDIIKESLLEYDTKDYYTRRGLVAQLNILKKFLCIYVVMFNSTISKKSAKAEQEFSMINFIRKYCAWLIGDDKQIKYYNAKLFNPDNEIFQRFIEWIKDEYHPNDDEPIQLLELDKFDEEMKSRRKRIKRDMKEERKSVKETKKQELSDAGVLDKDDNLFHDF